jgi:hypothetical protein
VTRTGGTAYSVRDKSDSQSPDSRYPSGRNAAFAPPAPRRIHWEAHQGNAPENDGEVGGMCGAAREPASGLVRNCRVLKRKLASACLGGLG